MSRHVKFEDLLVESSTSISTPSIKSSSLFDSMDPMEALSPQSYDDGSMFGESPSGTPAPESQSDVDMETQEDKKVLKKRKSWGQVLPEPKTNLPPRKRAKTEDEKEQRRVERVLRNRRAAQTSRERKRQEVETLEEEKRKVEDRANDLERRLAAMEARNLMLQQQIDSMANSNMTVFRGSSPARSEQLRASSPVTFSQELFGSQNDVKPALVISIDENIKMDSPTVNPASLSPKVVPSDDSNARTSDLTQHPAAVLCDLQCQSEVQWPWTSFQIYHSTILYLTTTSIISTLLSPLQQIISSLQTGSSLCPTPSILTTLIWLATTPAHLNHLSRTNSTSTTSSKTTSSSPQTSAPRNRRRFSLRIILLERLLACSPHLARPLKDATIMALRSALAEKQDSLGARSAVGTVGVTSMGRHQSSNGLINDAETQPRWEALMTLLWSATAFEKRMSGAVGNMRIRRADGVSSRRGTGNTVKLSARSSISTRGYETKRSLSRPGQLAKTSQDGWRKALRRRSRRR